MNKYKYLGKNIGVLTLSNLATKLLYLILVPIYTSYLSTEDYGQFDFIQTTINLLIPILTLNIAESALIFLLDARSKVDEIIEISFKWIVIGCVIIAALTELNHETFMSVTIDKYWYFFIILFIVNSIDATLINIARGLDKVGHLAVSSVITSVLSLSTCVLFLRFFKWGLKGFFSSSIIGLLSQCIYLIVSIRIWQFIKTDRIDKCKEKEMLSYSCPLIANSIAWWVNSVSDRYVLIAFCGYSVSGIYAVSSKIPAILNMFQSVFNQAWTLSAVKDYDREDQNGFFSVLYNSYNALMVSVCTILIFFNKPIAKVLYSNEFYDGWKYAPFLMMGVIFGAVSGYIGGIFAAVKDSKQFASSTVIGAIVNLLMNFVLVPVMGAMGAAFATAVSYWLVYFIRIRKVRKHISMKVNLLRDNISYILIFIQILILLNYSNPGSYFLQAGVCILVFVLYYREYKTMVNKLRIL